MTKEQWLIIVMFPFAYIGILIFIKVTIVDFVRYLITGQIPNYIKKLEGQK